VGKVRTLFENEQSTRAGAGAEKASMMRKIITIRLKPGAQR